MLIKEILFVSIGAVIGALIRYGICSILSQFNLENGISGKQWGIIIVNILGALLIGYVSIKTSNHNLKLLLITGLLGSLTTFSTFVMDIVELWNRDHYHSIIYFILNILLGVIFFLLGRLYALKNF